MKIKICGLNSIHNIKQIYRLSPDYIGLIFHEKSARNAENLPNQFIKQLISNKIKKVGVFVDATIDLIERKIRQYSLDCIQLHGSESPVFCYHFKSKIEVIKAFLIGTSFNYHQIKQYQNTCNYFLFDCKGKYKGGNGMKFNWKLLDDYNLNTPFFLSGGISENDVDAIQALKTKSLHAIDINSCFEEFPGFKNIEKTKRFITKIRINYELQNQ